ncbi:MAG: hypothetical protein PWR10_382 [Halanaerobiales bacterium]|nr:hypothetical protein [Halanaerobiales bacterium]
MTNNYKQRVRTIKYGGIKYINNVPTEQINRFVMELPEERRSSMAEVTRILEEEGLISLIHDDRPSPPCE